MAGCGLMWQGMGACDKGYEQLARGGVGTCGRGYGHVAEWGHVAGVWGMWQGWICENMSNVKKSKMLTMNEVHKNFNLTQ